MRLGKHWLVTALLLTALATPASAGMFRSQFGFKAMIPENWIALARKDVLDEKLSVADLAKTAGLKGANREFLSQIIGRIRSGEVEFIFRKSRGRSDFADNLNFLQHVGALPDPVQMKEFCQVLPQELSRLLGMKIAMYRCKTVPTAARPAVYVEFEGEGTKTRTMQYQLQQAPGTLLIITATATDVSVEEVRPELDLIVESLEFD